MFYLSVRQSCVSTVGHVSHAIKHSISSGVGGWSHGIMGILFWKRLDEGSHHYVNNVELVRHTMYFVEVTWFNPIVSDRTDKKSKRMRLWNSHQSKTMWLEFEFIFIRRSTYSFFIWHTCTSWFEVTITLHAHLLL